VLVHFWQLFLFRFTIFLQHFNVCTKKKTKEKGFTLIELLIVVAIMGILSAVFFFHSSEARKKADDAHMKTEASSIQKAIVLYQNDNNGEIPYSTNTGVILRENDDRPQYAGEFEEIMQMLVDGEYLAEIPNSPNGVSYHYYASDDTKNAVFAADLNYEQEEEVNNSCEVFVPEDVGEYENCDNATMTMPEQEGGPPLLISYSCDYVEYDEDTQVCIEATFGDVIDYCVCNLGGNSYSNSPGEYPDIICQNHMVGGPMPGTCMGWFNNNFVYLCDVIQPPDESVVCGGGDDSDFCQCI
jgi:prepilin-type N-terminal cleavage/methylation domain-containing protein